MVLLRSGSLVVGTSSGQWVMTKSVVCPFWPKHLSAHAGPSRVISLGHNGRNARRWPLAHPGFLSVSDERNPFVISAPEI